MHPCHTIRFIAKCDIEKKLPLITRKSIARFYAYGYANSLVYYLANYKNKTLDGLYNMFAFLDEIDLRINMQNQLKHERNNRN